MTKQNSTEVRKKQNKHVELPSLETATFLEEKPSIVDLTEGRSITTGFVDDSKSTGGKNSSEIAEKFFEN